MPPVKVQSSMVPDVEVLLLSSDLPSGSCAVKGVTRDAAARAAAPEALCNEDWVHSDEGGELTAEMREAASGAASVAARAAIAAVAVYDQDAKGTLESAEACSAYGLDQFKPGHKVVDVSSLGDEAAARILRSLRKNAHHSLPALANSDSRRAYPSPCQNHYRDSGDDGNLEADIIADLQRHNDKLRWELRSVLKGRLSFSLCCASAV